MRGTIQANPKILKALKKLDNKLTAESVIEDGKLVWDILRYTEKGTFPVFRWGYPHLSFNIIAELQSRDTQRRYRRGEYYGQAVINKANYRDELLRKEKEEQIEQIKEQFTEERAQNLLEGLHYLNKRGILHAL